MAGRGESDSPIMFREIHKNAWLKRLQPAPTDGSRLLPHKKTPIRAQWTLLCVHDGSRPWLEQYADAASVPQHRAAWRVSLRAVRHVSPTLRPCSAGGEYAFVIATESGIIRMAAPDWDSMQEWVALLRTKLRELRALGGGENVYGAAPAARAPTRDPTSPLPPTPPAPAIRVPGIEPTPASSGRNTTQNQLNESILESTPEEVLQNHSTPETSQPINADNAESVNSVETNNSTNVTNSLNDTVNESEDNVESNSSATSTTNLTVNLVSVEQNANITVTNQAESSSSLNRDPAMGSKVVSTAILNKKSSPKVSPTNSFSQSPSLSNIASVTGQNVSLSNLTSHSNKFVDSITSLLSQQSEENVETQSPKSKDVPAKGVTKICGQNICLDDSVLNRNKQSRVECIESDEEFFTEFDKMSLEKFDEKLGAIVNDGVSRILLDSVGEKMDESLNKGKADSYTKVDLTRKMQRSEKFKQRVLVSVGSESESNLKSLQIKADDGSFDDGSKSATNVTVIQVSNTKRQPPHTAIPVLGSESDVFHFHFNQKLTIDCPSEQRVLDQRFVNVVNTGDQVQIQNLVSESKENIYGTIFDSEKVDEEPYGHISLTTTVKINNDNVTENTNGDSVYERLCLASTSNRTEDSNRNLTKDTFNRQSIEASCSRNENRDTNYEFLYLGNNRPSVSVSRSKSQREADGLPWRLQSGSKESSENCARVKSLQTSEENAREEKVDVVEPKREKKVKTELNGLSRCSRSPLRENGVNYQRFDKQVPNAVKSVISHKGLLKRGLTELSFLSKLRSRGQPQAQGKTSEIECRSVKPQSQQGVVSPSRHTGVVRRARAETRQQEGRRRSSSLSGEPSPPDSMVTPICGAPPQSLRARQAAALTSEQLRPALLRLRRADTRSGQIPPLALVDAFGAVWLGLSCSSGVCTIYTPTSQQALVAGWCGRVAIAAHGRLHAGDWLAAVDGARPRSARHARTLISEGGGPHVDLLFHRVPHGKIFVVTKDREDQGIGLQLNADAEITGCDADSPAARAGIPPAGAKWAITEVNSRPLNLLKGAGAQAQSRLESRGAEVSVLLQPAALVLRLRQGLKAHRNATEYVVQ